MPSSIAARDGSSSFGSGVNSIATTTLSGPQSLDGLKRTELAWLINGTVRDSGITQRSGWLRVGLIYGNDGLFQGSWIYEPIGAFPYAIWVVSGHVLKVDLDTAAVVDLSVQFGLYLNPTEPFAYYVQAEEFAVIQAGDFGKGGPVIPGVTDADGNTLPLFYDGVTLRRSNGITGNVGQPSAPVYTITTTNFFVVPGVGGTTGLLTADTDGIVAGTYTMRATGGQFDIGTFVVSNIVANTSFDITTVSSDWIGHNFPPFEYRFTDTTVPTPVLINEIPAATAMSYYQYRIFYAQDRIVSAGDIVYGSSGTAAYGFRDSVLKVTENPLAIGGDGFAIPTQSGTIRGLAYGANIDTSVGQGRLFIFTTKAVYALQVPVTRDDWINAGANNTPLMVVVQLNNGSVNDRSIVAVNGDLFYQSLEPGIRSLNQSSRLFTQWANMPLSANINRILQFNDRSILRAASGIFFSNRVIQTALPRQTLQGIVHDAIVPLDVMPSSSFGQFRQPNWEGSQEGTAIFQMSTADFGGRERAFAAVRSEDGSIELWELSTAEKFDYALEPSEETRRVKWQVETPAWTFADTIGQENLKKLVSAEFSIDRLTGTVEFEVEYRPDSASCWIPWMQWTECNAKNTAEIAGVPPGYPVPLGACYRATMVLPRPPETCADCGIGRPAYIAFMFQLRITMRGFCRLRGIWVHAESVERSQYPAKSMVC